MPIILYIIIIFVVVMYICQKYIKLNDVEDVEDVEENECNVQPVTFDIHQYPKLNARINLKQKTSK